MAKQRAAASGPGEGCSAALRWRSPLPGRGGTKDRRPEGSGLAQPRPAEGAAASGGASASARRASPGRAAPERRAHAQVAAPLLREARSPPPPPPPGPAAAERARPLPARRPASAFPPGPPPPAPDPRPKLALGGGRRWSSPLSPLSGRGGAAEDVYDVPHGARSARRPAAGNFLKEAPRGGPQRVGARARPGGPGPRRHPQSDSPRDLLQVSSPRGPRFPPLSAEQSHLNSNMETTGAGSGRKELSERRQLSPCALRLLPSLPPGDHHP
ncbi:skin secretory protein xP2-like isoform X1 [Canis lupus familiaris]|uniref:skin secretory protein xP2-like isoform X1 n=1 Tax=Canis lupus familiaris TaxID=9615 RepID=UPI0018F7DC54|nr:skin secretory protein xP2-like isoform X1 [Canis lupus familiaris]